MEESEIKESDKNRLYNRPSQFYKLKTNGLLRKLEKENKLSKNHELKILSHFKEGKVNTRNIVELRNAVHELDAIIEENGNQIHIVKEAEAIKLNYKTLLKQARDKDLVNNKLKMLISNNVTKSKLKSKHKKSINSKIRHTQKELERLQEQALERGGKLELLNQFRLEQLRKHEKFSLKLTEKEKRTSILVKGLQNQSKRKRREKRKEKTNQIAQIYKRKEQIEKEENMKLWKQLQSSQKNLHHAIENHCNNYFEKQDNIIAQNSVFHKMFDEKSTKQKRIEIQHEKLKRLKSLRYEELGAEIIRKKINTKYFDDSCFTMMKGYECKISNILGNELDMKNRVFVARIETISCAFLCYFTSQQEFFMLFRPDQQFPSGFRKFEILLFKPFRQWDLNCISEKELRSDLSILRQENQKYMIKIEEKEEKIKAILEFERKREYAIESRKNKEEKDLKTKTEKLKNKDKKFLSHYARIRKDKKNQMKMWRENRKNYEKANHINREELEKNQEEYQNYLRNYIQRKHERVHYFLRNKEQMKENNIRVRGALPDENDKYITLVNKLIKVDDLNPRELKRIGIDVAHLNKKDIQKHIDHLLRLVNSLPDTYKPQPSIQKSKSSPNLCANRRGRRKLILSDNQESPRCNRLQFTLTSQDDGKYTSDLHYEFPVNPSRRIVSSMQFI